ncbi:MAG TPA: fatty acid desaturase [Chitinophagaceae bacterium]|nr:fatty acid desaturase [Chitinophagaceae bacterium]
MAFIDNILQAPTYGWADADGKLIVPTTKQLWKEAFSRVNIFKSKKNWISMVDWLMIGCLLPFFYVFVVYYFSWQLVIAIVVYSMIIMGTHGTIWFHRFGTHRSYKFSHPIWRFITQNLVIKTLPEETYIVSHHVHHSKSDQPGDPYNARGGFLYCMLATVNHQAISKTLSEADYKKATRFMNHTGVWLNNYKQYRKWGSLASPFYTVALWVLNWAFWYTVLFFIGGHGLACALFTAAMLWFILVRAFNYTGHGKGEEKHIDGIDFDRSNLSINQSRPGLFAGEWHNNHHLFPGSARAGFLPYQLDLAWIYIYCLYKIGAVSSYHDSKKDFLRKYHAGKKVAANPAFKASYQE